MVRSVEVNSDDSLRCIVTYSYTDLVSGIPKQANNPRCPPMMTPMYSESQASVSIY